MASRGFDSEQAKRLMQAAMNGDVGSISELIGQGVDVEAKDAEGNTALHYTGWRGRMDACLILLKAGASIETCD